MVAMKDQGKRKRPQGDAVPAAKRPKSDASQRRNKPSDKQQAKQPVKLLSKREQKDARKQKKLKLKKNYATIQETVLLWEELRPKQTTKEQKAQLVSQILKKIQGNVVGLSNHHSASRVIQWCLKEGSASDQAGLMAEVRANIIPLSKSKYGRHVVQKLITVASKEEVPDLVKLFKGHVAELLRHPCGADVLDDLYNVASTSYRNSLAAELYGREFSLFGGVSLQGEAIAHLGQLLSGVDEGKRAAVIQHLYKGLAPVLEKALLHTALTHRLLRELLTEAPGALVADVVDTLAATGGMALKLVHTHDGAAAAAMALAYGTPKDRKRLVKGMKGYVWQTCENEWGHAVVATALSVVDDTSLTGKVILGELKGHMEELCTNKHAHRVLMQLLAPDSHRYLPPAIYELLHPPAKTMMVAAAAGAAAAGLDEDDEELDEAALVADDEEQADEQQAASEDAEDSEAEDEEGEGTGAEEQGSEEGAEQGSEQQQEDTGQQAAAALVEKQLGESKKAADVRRQELLGSGPDSLSAGLVALCAEQASQLLKSPVGSEVLVEVARGAAGGLLWQLQQQGVEAVHAALVQQIQQDLSTMGSSGGSNQGPKPQESKKAKSKGKAGSSKGGDEAAEAAGDAEPLLTHYFGSRALRRLLLAASGEEAEGAGARAFAELLWVEALQGHCQQLVGGHAEKVLAALLHCGVDSVVQAASAELRPLVGADVEAWAAKLLGPPGQQQQQGQQQAAKQQQVQVQTDKQQKGTGAGKKKKQLESQAEKQQTQMHTKPGKKHKGHGRA